MIIFLTVIITLLIVILLEYIFFKLSIPYFQQLIEKAIDISCYENTFHYMNTEGERVRDGQEKYVKSLFKDKVTNFKKEKAEFIFDILYTKIFTKLLCCIPIKINRYNNRCLEEDEVRKTEKILDDYLKKQERMYLDYASDYEKQNRIDKESVQCENKSN
ncbi:MAG: hypothetical protein ACI3T9_03190 [Romboutsia timonensis]